MKWLLTIGLLLSSSLGLCQTEIHHNIKRLAAIAQEYESLEVHWWIPNLFTGLPQESLADDYRRAAERVERLQETSVVIYGEVSTNGFEGLTDKQRHYFDQLFRALTRAGDASYKLMSTDVSNVDFAEVSETFFTQISLFYISLEIGFPNLLDYGGR